MNRDKLSLQELNPSAPQPAIYKEERCVSWSAIVAGALIALGLTFLFNLLTLGGGFSAYIRTDSGIDSLAMGAFLWMVVGGFLVLFVTGWLTGRLATRERSLPMHGAIHGFIAWALYLLISLSLLSNFTSTFATAIPQTLAITQNDSDQSASNDTQMRVDQLKAKRDANQLDTATLAGFLILLAGALGCCAGGYYGIGNREID